MPHEVWIKQGVEHLLLGILYFGNLFILFPKLYNKGRRVLYALSILVSFLLIIGIVWWLFKLLDIGIVLAQTFSTPDHPFSKAPTFDGKWVTLFCITSWGLSCVSWVVKKLQTNQLAFERSEKERISAELSYLKAQINPHFFFNTLHTIYSLMDTDLASAKSSIYNLSHMMRYVLYDTKNDLVSLYKELSFIEDYIALMKVRIWSNVQIIFDRQPGIQNIPIAPMLFLPFVENAFKHGISAIHPSYIFIEVAEFANELHFEVRNSLFEELGTQLEDSGGIGITNTRRRLDLIYPGRYQLLAERDNFSKEYSVTLILSK